MKRTMKRINVILAGLLWLNQVLPVAAEELPDPSPFPVEEVTEEPETLTEPEESEVPEETLPPEEEPEPEEQEEQNEPETSEEPEEESPAWADRLIVIGAEAIRDRDHVIAVYEDMTLLGFSGADSLQEACAYYSTHALHAEPDGVVLAAEDGGDLKDAPNEISADNNPIDQLQELLAEEASVPSGSAPLIALIDTGVGPDLPNPAGAVSVLGDDPSDDNGHGNRMAGYILAEDPSARILSIKALDANGHGTISSVYAGLRYAAEQGADIVALCMAACVSSESAVLQETIDQMAAQGITVVGAAGNSGLNVKYFVPGNTASALIAGSCDREGTIRSFSNYGETLDYLVVSDSTSEAAARLAGILSRCKNEQALAETDPRVYLAGGEETDEPAEEPDPDADRDFYSQCNAFFYGDVYFWEVPYGETTTGAAELIPGYQQEVLNAKTDQANGYSVQFQNIADETFSAGHGYAVFASTHKAAAVSSWGSSVHVNDYRGSYEAWGRNFDSAKKFSISAKTIPNFDYLGVIVSQNKTAKPGSVPITSLSKAESASVRLGETDATYWDDVPGVNTDYWKGWAHTSSGTEYPSFRVDFYYQSTKPHYALTVNYLEEGTEEPVAEAYGPKQIMETASYSVPSPDLEDYELVHPEEAVITGVMPDHDVTYTVYYRRVYKIKTKVINGTITLNNEMEADGTTGDETWNAEGAVKHIHAGEDRTIRYQNRPDYVLDYVMVDGEPADPVRYPEAYLFSGVTEDHTIEVRYVPSPVPDDAKQVKNEQGALIDGQMVNAGDVLTYTVRVINVFSTPQEFELTDRIPERTAYVTDSADYDGTMENGTLFWKFTLEAGEERTVSFRVIVLPDAKDTVVKNKAEAAVNNLKLTTNETENPVLPDPVKQVETEEGEDCDGQMVPVDRSVRYTITVKNPGNTEQEFTIIDEVDAGHTVDPSSISDQGRLNGRTITWTITVPAGESASVSFTALPTDLELTIPNHAEVRSSSAHAYTNETVIYTPGKAVKTVTTADGLDLDGKAIAQNELFVYRISVTNPSAKNKTYQVTDTVPEAAEITEAGTYGDTYEKGGAGAAVSGQTVTWTKELAGGETMDLYILCRLKESGVTFANQALVRTDNIETPTNEVTNWSGQILINAEIEEYWEPYGQPSFLYDIQDGNGMTWHRMIVVDSKTKTGQAVFDIPTGHDPDTWVITDEAGSRYRFRRAAPETENVTVSGNRSDAVITPDSRIGITRYFYGISRWDETSHLDAVTNTLPYRRS